MAVPSWVRGFGSVVASAVVLILLALVYFIVTAWIVTFGVDTVTGREPSADFVAISAAILSIGGLAGSSLSLYAPGESDPEPPDPYEMDEVT